MKGRRSLPLPGEANRVSRVVGVDVGGTFTDVVVLDGESIAGHKVRTTTDQSVGVALALSDTGIDDATTILHGTTAGTNALIQGKGARTALVTTRGFEDLLEIGRQARPSLYDPLMDRPAALSPRDLRFGYAGDVEAICGLVEEAGVEAVAVALVRSYLDPSEEIDLARRLSDRVAAPVSVGAVISPQFREYERIETTVLNAYPDAGARRLLVPSRRRGRGRHAADDDLVGWVAPLRRGVGLRRPPCPVGPCGRCRGRLSIGPRQRP